MLPETLEEIAVLNLEVISDLDWFIFYFLKGLFLEKPIYQDIYIYIAYISKYLYIKEIYRYVF